MRKLIRVSLVAALGLSATLLAYGMATASPQDKKDEVPDIKEIMVKGHKGTEAYMAKIKTAAKDGKWEDAQKYAKTLAFFGESLGKNKPSKGDADSWKALSEKYAASTKSVFEAAEKKDAKGVNAGLAAIGGSCGACHKMHK